VKGIFSPSDNTFFAVFAFFARKIFSLKIGAVVYCICILLKEKIMRVTVTTFQESSSAIRQVRDAVFGEEQHIPRELDWDGSDEVCVQALATDDYGNPIGTGRLQTDGRIGRIAVLKEWRGRGIGAHVLQILADAARTRGIQRVYLHAQSYSVEFYEKSGFHPDGGEFLEAGISHVTMIKEFGH
jgi:predicted GNAT family N-acyltransferase